jgi:hypothetical protein
MGTYAKESAGEAALICRLPRELLTAFGSQYSFLIKSLFNMGLMHFYLFVYYYHKYLLALIQYGFH